MADQTSPATRFSRRSAARIVTHGASDEVRQLFDEIGPRLTAMAAARFDGFTRALLTRNKDNYGLYFVHRSARVPFLWLGLAWSPEDTPGTLPSWGLSLEVDGDEVARFLDNSGGLYAACQAVDARKGEVQLFRFERHLELACWRPFSWLLDAKDQGEALVAYWQEYLDMLAAGGLPAAVEAFIEAPSGT